jgi:hypothetical protein
VEQYDDGFPPSSLAEFQGWLSEYINKIPVEHRRTAQVEIDSVGSFEDTHYAKIRISYTRPMTDEERAQEQAQTKRAQAEIVAHELALLRGLKAKYGG